MPVGGMMERGTMPRLIQRASCAFEIPNRCRTSCRVYRIGLVIRGLDALRPVAVVELLPSQEGDGFRLPGSNELSAPDFFNDGDDLADVRVIVIGLEQKCCTIPTVV